MCHNDIKRSDWLFYLIHVWCTGCFLYGWEHYTPFIWSPTWWCGLVKINLVKWFVFLILSYVWACCICLIELIKSPLEINFFSISAVNSTLRFCLDPQTDKFTISINQKEHQLDTLWFAQGFETIKQNRKSALWPHLDCLFQSYISGVMR